MIKDIDPSKGAEITIYNVQTPQNETLTEETVEGIVSVLVNADYRRMLKAFDTVDGPAVLIDARNYDSEPVVIELYDYSVLKIYDPVKDQYKCYSVNHPEELEYSIQSVLHID